MNDRYVRFQLAVGIALLTVAVYLPSLRNNFVNWDDDLYVYGNLNIRSLNLAFFRWAFSDYHAGNWYPLTLISHAIDYALWGLNPLGHHLSNIVLHAANTFIVVLLLMKLLDMSNCLNFTSTGVAVESIHARNRNNLAGLIAAGVAGLLFGLHPLHVEPVAWVSGRKDLLCGLFFLLSIMAYSNYAATRMGVATSLQSGTVLWKRRYFLSLVFFFFALASKPMAVSLPAVLLILDWYPFQRIRSVKDLSAAIMEKIPFIALSLLASIAAFIAQKTAGYMPLMETIPLSTRVLVAVKSIALYLWKAAVPLHLLPFYPFPESASLVTAEYLSAIMAVAGITAVCIFFINKQRVLMAVWLSYLVTLLPVLGIVKVGAYSMADRYMYLPSVGPFLLVGVFSAWFRERTASQQQRGTAIQRMVAVVALALLVLLSYLTLRQISHWKDSMTLWNYVIEKEPSGVPVAFNNRGLIFREKGQFDQAIDDFNAAIRLSHDYTLAYINRGMTFAEKGQFDRAIDDFSVAIGLNPGYAEAYNHRGLLFGTIGQIDRALNDFNNAIRINPASTEVYNNRGLAFEYSGQLDRAIENYSKAIELDPSDYSTYINRGIAYGKMNRLDRAIDDYTKALALQADVAKAYLERADLYWKTGDKERAVTDFQKACELGDAAGCDAVHTFGKQ